MADMTEPINDGIVHLYALEASDRYFWRDSFDEQVDLEVRAMGFERLPRPMTDDAMLAMALNEICVHHGRGFFMHLRTRTSFRSRLKLDPSLAPPSRIIREPER